MSKNPGFGTSYSYDGHGNILSLSRGKGDGSSDLLTMSYIGNRLHGMTDGNGGSLIPESLAVTLPADTEHYAYDANGNMTRDHVSGITAMSYNRINLPANITVVDSGKVSNVSYAYTSDGTKQRASVTDASGESLTKDWCSNLVYLNGELDRILIPGGYIKDGSYRFFLTDHLGSVRAVADSDGNVLETIDYYPYGQEISDGTAMGNDAASLDETLQPYRFNGKESQAFAGLPYLDYGARFYHPQSTRWTTMDPLAEKYYYVSPYVYCLNDPLNRIDPDGQTDWRLVAAGALATLSGVGTLAGAIATEVGTATAATPLCAFLAVDGFTSIGLGVSTILVGIVSEPSEKTDLLLENMPTSALNTLTKSADIVAGNESHEIETTVSVLSAGKGLGGVFKAIKEGTINPLSVAGNVADWMSLMLQSNSDSNSNSDQDNESQNDGNDDSDDK